MKYVLLAMTLTLGSAKGATMNGFELGAYGFIKSSAMYADKALGSYNNINLSAPTHAVAQTRSQDKTSRFSFQTQQSRIGTTLTKEKLSAKLEFDFIDFAKSSPTTQMLPRVRIAAVTYTWDNNKVIIGQDWDLFSPVNSYTYDYVGLYFLAGNTGFMRQQAQYLKTLGNWELGGALGMAGNNPGVTDNDLELGKSPAYAGRLTYNLNEGKLGISTIYTTLHFETTNGANKDSYGFNAFYEKRFGTFGIKSEAYYGQNLANIGTLSIGKGSNVKNAKEYGASLTAWYNVDELHSFFGGLGTARIDNRSELVPYALSGTSVITAPGIAKNFLARVGYEYKVTPDLSWLSELSRYETESKLADNKYDLSVAHSLETGIQFRF